MTAWNKWLLAHQESEEAQRAEFCWAERSNYNIKEDLT